MDQDTVVTEQTDGGKRLIEALAAEGFEVRAAFWAKPTEEGQWFLYLASPVVDEKGKSAAYRVVHRVVRQKPDLWIDPFEVRVVGMTDSMAQAAMELMKPKVPDSQFAVQSLKPSATWFHGSSLGGVDVDGAYIYPPLQAAASA